MRSEKWIVICKGTKRVVDRASDWLFSSRRKVILKVEVREEGKSRGGAGRSLEDQQEGKKTREWKRKSPLEGAMMMDHISLEEGKREREIGLVREEKRDGAPFSAR